MIKGSKELIKKTLKLNGLPVERKITFGKGRFERRAMLRIQILVKRPNLITFCFPFPPFST
jgi:hypothetical protein